jgi:Protein of unknown function (DUF1592)/Protein of unknown function (DUF1588)/Protein of unknown function (DUF1595)/Protein of unknown function (DUF1585)
MSRLIALCSSCARWLLCCAALAGGPACTGEIGAQSDPPNQASEPPPDDRLGPIDEPVADQPPSGPPGPRPLLRLDRTELGNTLKDLLGVPVEVPSTIFDTKGRSGFTQGAPFTSVEADILVDWTGKLTADATDNLVTLAGCTATPAEAERDACAKTFIERFGRRAFRRPLTEGEIEDLFNHYRERLRKESNHDHRMSLRGLAWLMLQSPRFLYHWEKAPGPAQVRDGRVVLGPHEIAARLSYLFWATMPDDVLSDAADQGVLDTGAAIQMQARRLLADPRGAGAVERFILQWFGIRQDLASKKVESGAVKFTPELGAAMVAESRRFVRAVVEEGASIKTLLTSRETSIDHPDLARIYGVSVPGAAGMTPISLDPTLRSGLLTTPAFLTSHSLHSGLNPISRGLAIVEGLLCMEVPAPPPEVNTVLVADPTLSTRALLAKHAENSCATCHRIFDPMGMTFEHYDAVGAFRTMDKGEPVDSAAMVTLPSGDEKAVANAVEMASVLAQSDDVLSCLAQKFTRYVLGRPDGEADAPSVALARAALPSPTDDLRELMVAITSSPAFVMRAPASDESKEQL